MANNKIVFGEEVLLDLTGDTVTPDRLADGYTAHDRSGEPIVGTMTPNKPVDVASNDAMTAIAARATENDLGKIYLFVGEDDGVFEKDALYILIKKGSGYGFQRYAIGGSGESQECNCVIDVTELPAGGGTPVVGKWTLAELEGVGDPTTIPPEVENIYFNTALSTEEVVEILSKLTFTSTGEGDIVCSVYGINLTVPDLVALGFIRLGAEYAIISYIDELIIFATDGFAAEMGTTGGWNPDFNGTLAVNGILVKPGEATELGLPVDNQQEKYSGLISLTPGFEPADVDETAVYRVTKKVNADVYYRYNAEDPDGYLNLKAILASKGITSEITYYVLDAYPESPEVTNLQTLNPGHVYIINDIPQVYGNMGSGNTWVTVTDMLISEGITTTDCGYTADITKETQIGTFVTYKTEVTLHYYKDGKWHGGGGSGGIVDVEELPDVNTVDEAVIYRTKGNSAQLWFKNGNNLASLEQFYAAFGGLSVTYYVVDSLPSNPVITSNTNGAYVYVVKSTGFAYSSSDGSTYSPMSLTGNPKGWISSLDEITEDGDYTLRARGGVAYAIPKSGAEVYTINGGEWRNDTETLAALKNIESEKKLVDVKLAAALSGLDGDEGSVNFIKYASLQSEDGGITLTGLSDNSVTSITIPDGVTKIAPKAFKQYGALTSVTIPSSVTSIGEYAFQLCSNLTSVTIPSSVTSIGEYAFARCTSLTGITIPDSVTSIGASTFLECSSLTSVNIPNGVTSIGVYAFAECTNLTSITIPDSVTSIGAYAFQLCSSLTSVIIPNGVTSISDRVFDHCSSLTSVNIPNGVTSIGNCAFNGCEVLAGVTIPGSVTSIGDWAFGGCEALANVTIHDGVTSIGTSAFGGCTSLTSITIPSSVTSIGNSAFSSCSGLTELIIPDSVTSIGSRAFGYCSGLTSVTIPSSVTSIGEALFYRCSGLTSVIVADDNPYYHSDGNCIIETGSRTLVAGCNVSVIPDGVTGIGTSALSGCSGFTSITIPSSVTGIGSSAFDGCSNLTSVTIPDGVTSISYGVFNSCYSLTSLIFLGSITFIGAYAFQNAIDMSYYDFTSNTVVPKLSDSSTTFSGIPTDCEIRVPAALYDEWVVATNWSKYASNIVAV